MTREESRMSRLYVRLRPVELDALREAARAERRHPSDQAALLLAEALKQAPPPLPTKDTPRQPVEAGAAH